MKIHDNKFPTWQHFKEMVFDRSLSDFEDTYMKLAFYAGAVAVTGKLTKTDESAALGLVQIMEECNDYFDMILGDRLNGS